MRCPHCSGQLIEEQPTCPTCGWVRPVRPVEPPQTTFTDGWHDADDTEPINTSGSNLPPPPEVRDMGFCWGGFGLPHEFAWANNIAWGCFGGRSLLSYRLARDGHVLAWQSRRFASFRQFQRTMRVWNRWGIASTVARGAVILLVIAALLSDYGSFGRGSSEPVTEAQADATSCLENMRSIAIACRTYTYNNDGRLPLAGNWPAAIKPWLPKHKLWPCPLKTTVRLNRNVAGKRLDRLDRFVGLVYEADAQGRIAYVHPSSCGGSDANVACSNGEAFGECSKHPGRVDWAGPPPPGLAAKEPGAESADTSDNSK